MDAVPVSSTKKTREGWHGTVLPALLCAIGRRLLARLREFLRRLDRISKVAGAGLCLRQKNGSELPFNHRQEGSGAGIALECCSGNPTVRCNKILLCSDAGGIHRTE